MRTGTLNRLRARAAVRRLGTGGGPLAALAGAAGLVAVAWAAHGLGLRDGAPLADGDAEAVARVVRERAFWFATGAALIYAYTTFEVLFRAADAAFVALLPVRGSRRWLELELRALALHAPLLVPGLGYAWGAWSSGALDAGLAAAGMAAASWLVGLAACAWIHLLAGRSLLSEADGLERWLAGGLVTDDAALLLYAPAAGLAAALGATVLLDAAFARGAGAAPALLLAVAVAAALAAGAARGADRVLHLVVPRFAEVDAPYPYSDEGVPEPVAGELLARWLPHRARPYYLRSARQLRRRFVIDRLLLWVFVAWAARAAWAFEAGDPLARHVTHTVAAWAGLLGLVWVGAFRQHGGELGSAWIDQTLPRDRRGEWLGELAADAWHPGQALVVAALASALGVGPLAGVAVLAAGLLSGTLVILATMFLARAAARGGRSAAISWAWRAVVLAATATLLLMEWSP